jgi:uncharacterized protein (DUF608 family)
MATRKCNCSGVCGPQNDDLTRREFIELIGGGAAAAMFANSAWGAFELPADQFARWRGELLAAAKPPVYCSDRHTDARMHLGGIGTGNFEIGADGRLTAWQLFNTLRDGEMPFYFLLKTGRVQKLLQTAGGPGWPRIQRIEMRGEYPRASLRFIDSETPVQVELEAFTPFAPLDGRFSSLPLAAFIFRIHNPTQQSHTVSLAAVAQNPVGYEAAGENNSPANPCFGWNVNEVLRRGKASGILMRAEAAAAPAIDQPVTLYVGGEFKGLKSPPFDLAKGLAIEVLDAQGVPQSEAANVSKAVIWLEDAPASTSEAFMRQAAEAVRGGATLLFSGRSMPLLQAYASWTAGKPVAEVQGRADIVFEDFEHGYENWRVEGEAFGKAPAHGTLPNQQPVSGFLGRGLVNSFYHGDAATGRLISKPFVIERRFIRFLVGGGRHVNTQIRLMVAGNMERATSGKDNERLEPAVWDVAELEGQTARIEIVDEEKGGWGHINVDQIEFSDFIARREVMLLLEELLPARFSKILPAPDSTPAQGVVEFENFTLQPGAAQSAAPATATEESRAGLVLFWRPVGRGKVVLASGAVLDPAVAHVSHQRQRAYQLVCGLAGARYRLAQGQHPQAAGFGTMALATLARKATVLAAFEDWQAAWQALNQASGFAPLNGAQSSPPTPIGRTLHGGLAATVRVPAGATVEVPFLLAWHFPNKYSGQTWTGCHYATQWTDASAVIAEAAANFPALRRRTDQFRTAFYDSTLPYWLLDCITANAATLRHIGVVFRIANGDIYGWEGSNGCCDPTCTHVWGYEQSLARLFPDLEKQMRRIDFTHQQGADGGINNRTQVPSPSHPTGEHPFTDGHASCILKAYREALNSPDDAFLKDYWPRVHRAVDYLIGRDAKASGGQPSGVLQDEQWNTYDEALHGVTTFISGYYLAALRAGEAWARRLGETGAADRFGSIFESGRQKLVELCWNGEYFQQHLPDYMERGGEVGPGCMCDQLIGQWWAYQLGLGYLLPKDKVVAALRAIFKYNFKSDLTGWKHAPRAFAGAGDKGLIVCTWPKGGRPPNMLLYSDEVWTGIEYQVAAHMIYEGLVEEGLALVKAARERYDGVPRAPIPRNPWNELECGGHYARAMSSWSLLLALSGWHYDGPRQSLRVTPRHTPENFRSFFTAPEGWGTLRQWRAGQRQRNEIALREGRLAISEIALMAPAAPATAKAEKSGKPLAAACGEQEGLLVVSLKRPAMVLAGETLVIHTA